MNIDFIFIFTGSLKMNSQLRDKSDSVVWRFIFKQDAPPKVCACECLCVCVYDCGWFLLLCYHRVSLQSLKELKQNSGVSQGRFPINCQHCFIFLLTQGQVVTKALRLSHTDPVSEF